MKLKSQNNVIRKFTIIVVASFKRPRYLFDESFSAPPLFFSVRVKLRTWYKNWSCVSLFFNWFKNSLFTTFCKILQKIFIIEALKPKQNENGDLINNLLDRKPHQAKQVANFISYRTNKIFFSTKRAILLRVCNICEWWYRLQISAELFQLNSNW